MKKHEIALNRAVQLDLARQKETLEFIETFIDFIAQNGFNQLYLHLESAVRTRNFSFADPEKSYSTDEIRRIVEYAKCRNITCVPVVATLGHAEEFLKHKILTPLSEQRNKPEQISRREFCPTMPETYDFLFDFLTEITELFPSEIIHVGCDEVFNLAQCPLCQKRLDNGESREDIFVGHLLKIYHFLTDKLRKKMQIWDDMADFIPGILPRLPKDLSLIFWEYDPVVEAKKTKFGNRKNIDIFRHYEKLGLRDFWAAPREFPLSNILSFSAYAQKYPVSGVLLTTWEHGKDFMPRFFPVIGCIGRMWSSGGNADDHFHSICSDLFCINDRTFSTAMQNVAEFDLIHSPLHDSFGCLKRPNADTGIQRTNIRLLLEILTAFQPDVKCPSGMIILEDTIISLSERLLCIDLELWCGTLLPDGDQTEYLRKRLLDLHQKRKDQWYQLRPALTVAYLLARQNAELKQFDRIETLLYPKCKIEISFFLPDFWGRENIEIAIGKEGAFTVVAQGMPKPAVLADVPYYSYFLTTDCTDIDAVKLCCHGWNGLGIVYVKLHFCDGRIMTPYKIETTTGLVEHPENMLVDDTTWSMFGNRDGLGLIFDESAGSERHSVVLGMKISDH